MEPVATALDTVQVLRNKRRETIGICLCGGQKAEACQRQPREEVGEVGQLGVRDVNV